MTGNRFYYAKRFDHLIDYGEIMLNAWCAKHSEVIDVPGYPMARHNFRDGLNILSKSLFVGGFIVVESDFGDHLNMSGKAAQIYPGIVAGDYAQIFQSFAPLQARARRYSDLIGKILIGYPRVLLDGLEQALAYAVNDRFHAERSAENAGTIKHYF